MQYLIPIVWQQPCTRTHRTLLTHSHPQPPPVSQIAPGEDGGARVDTDLMQKLLACRQIPASNTDVLGFQCYQNCISFKEKNKYFPHPNRTPPLFRLRVSRDRVEQSKGNCSKVEHLTDTAL